MSQENKDRTSIAQGAKAPSAPSPAPRTPPPAPRTQPAAVGTQPPRRIAQLPTTIARSTAAGSRAEETSPPPATPHKAAIAAAIAAPPRLTSSAQRPSLMGATIGMDPTGPTGSRVPAGLPPDDGDPDAFIGQELCGYTIKRKLAEGGMGVVYEGVHGKIGRRGAIKVLRLELCRSAEVVERFYQEARAVNAIRHENIVDIYDFGRDPSGRVFFVMEYLEGEPLSSRIRRGALRWHEAFPILEQTLRALKAAHDKGFVHCDLKPDNIWLRSVDGQIQVKLLDFGISKLVGAESPDEQPTPTGSVIGTPHYMSPEQINGARDLDHRTDVYAMGVIMYEMFAGVTPFVGDTLQAIMVGHLFHEPPRLAGLPADLGVPAPVAEIIDRMLVKDADGRYGSVADVLADLQDAQKDRQPKRAATPSRARPARGPTRVLRQAPTGVLRHAPTAVLAPAPTPVPAEPRRRRGLRTVALAGALALGAAVIAGVVHQRSRRTPEAVAEGTPRPPAPSPVATLQAAKVDDVPLDYDALRKDAQVTVRAGLRQTEPGARVGSADAIARIKDQPSEPKLTALVEHDPDPEVRARVAVALGALGASAAAPLLRKLERTDEVPELKVWYAAALFRLGDRAARRRLVEYIESARRKDLELAYLAGLELAETSQPGDRKTIKELTALAAREAELTQFDELARARILTRLVALRYAPARKKLYKLLEDEHEAVQLAAAEGLAKLGDDAGKEVLRGVLDNESSPHRLHAAVAQIPLGEYGGLALITEKLRDRDAEIRRRAAGALGEIGEPESLRPLLALAGDQDWTVRVAAAAAIVAIVGLDPLVLTQASVDWTKSALASKDWVVRKAAAGVLADLPEKVALPLLAQGIADPEPAVRLEVARAAGKLKTPEAARQLIAVVKGERDVRVKEQQVKALGEIGDAVARDTLAEISREDPGRVGVLAAGSLIAVGDPSGKDRLDAAVAAPQVELRLAAVQAASTAKNKIVVPTLLAAVKDLVFDVRFTAAEGLATYQVQQGPVEKVLRSALGLRDAGVIGRAVAALTRLGLLVGDKARSPEDMISSVEPKVRFAAVTVVRALPVDQAVALLRRLVLDPDPEVRRASVDAIEAVIPQRQPQAVRLYKPLLRDADPVVRAKASGQLARLVPAPPRPPAPPPGAAQRPDPQAPPPADTTPEVERAAGEAEAAAAEARAQAEAVQALVAELEAATARQPRDDTAIQRVGVLAASVDDAVTKLESLTAKIGAAATTASDVAGPSPTAAAQQRIAEARALAEAARAVAAGARAKVPEQQKQARRYVKAWTNDAQMLINTARAAMGGGNFAEAEQNLDKAAKLLRKSGGSLAEVDYFSVLLYVAMGDHAGELDEQRQHLERAREALARLEKSGAGPQVQDATAQLTELAEGIEQRRQQRPPPAPPAPPP